jgi:hypothetical protein
MSTIKTNAVQIGQSVTATNNFTFYQPAVPDGTVRIGNGNAGAATDKVTIDSNGNVSPGVTNTQTLGIVGDVWSNVYATTFTGTTGTFSGDVQMASANGGQLAGLRNRIINGNMGIFQRGATAVGTAGLYGPADRWKSDAAGDTFSTTQGSFVDGDTLYNTGGAQYFTTVAVTTNTGATTNYFKIGQGIEDVRILAGKTVTVSFWAKAVANTTIALEVWQSFGTGGSAAATGIGQAQAITTTWTQYSKTFTIPSVSGKTIGPSNTSLTQLEFWLDAGSSFSGVGGRAAGIGAQASKTVSIAQVQLEIGSVATPFEQRPYGMELALCQRYYQTHYTVIEINTLWQSWAYPVQFRATPVVSGGGAGFTVHNSNPDMFSFYQTTRAGATLTFNAEL